MSPELIRLPAVLKLIPVSKSSWYAGVKSGRYPERVHLGPRTTAWRLTDILELAKNGVGQLSSK
jgi:prophage regulatory protein